MFNTNTHFILNMSQLVAFIGRIEKSGLVGLIGWLVLLLLRMLLLLLLLLRRGSLFGIFSSSFLISDLFHIIFVSGSFLPRRECDSLNILFKLSRA